MYSNDTIAYYNTQLLNTYKSLCNNNPETPYILTLVANEEFDMTPTSSGVLSTLMRFLSQLGIVVKSLFVKLSLTLQIITKRYNNIFNKYYTAISTNKSNIDTTKFYNTKIDMVNNIVMRKRIRAVQQLFSILSNMDNILNASGPWDTVELKRAFSYLVEIGYDTQSQSLVNKISSSYKNDTISQTVNQHMYSINGLVSLLDTVRSFEPYTKDSFVTNLKRKFANCSEKLVNESRLTEDTSKKQILQVKLMRLWWCSHFIKAAYIITNDICRDMSKLCVAANNAIEES